MINITKVEINTLSDFDELDSKIDSLYIDQKIIDELKDRVKLRCKVILIEYPYRDKDFSSTFSGFHSKKHKAVPKECYRLHFFSEKTFNNDNYKGFMVLRPSYIANRGSAYLDPTLLLDSKKYLMLAQSKSHILGKEYTTSSYPWMSQETDIAICAHIAVWSVNRYFSEKFKIFGEYTMNDITDLTPRYIQRKTPSDGLTVSQIAEAFSNTGSHPILLKKSSDELGFYKNIYSYIESGIPVIGCMTKKEHAVSIIGHGSIDESKLDSLTSDFIYTSELISSLVLCDDNQLPYTEMSEASDNKHSIKDLDYAIVPLYEKMFLHSDFVRVGVEGLLKTKNINLPTPYVLRQYITSSKSLKEKISKDSSVNSRLKPIILKTTMPRFVWCVDISSKNEYKKSQISGKIIIDITAGTYEREPWILYHDSKAVHYYDTDINKFLVENFKITPYNEYVNNLKEV